MSEPVLDEAAQLRLIANMIIHRYAVDELKNKSAVECVKWLLEKDPVRL